MNIIEQDPVQSIHSCCFYCEKSFADRKEKYTLKGLTELGQEDHACKNCYEMIRTKTLSESGVSCVTCLKTQPAKWYKISDPSSPRSYKGYSPAATYKCNVCYQKARAKAVSDKGISCNDCGKSNQRQWIKDPEDNTKLKCSNCYNRNVYHNKRPKKVALEPLSKKRTREVETAPVSKKRTRFVTVESASLREENASLKEGNTALKTELTRLQAALGLLGRGA